MSADSTAMVDDLGGEADAGATGQGVEGATTTAESAEDTKGSEFDADAESKSSEDQGDEGAGAPESYGDFTLPEGYELTGEALNEFSDFGKELGLSQEQAQAVIDYGLKRDAQVVEQYEAARAEEWAEIHDSWLEAVKTDKELGGDNLDASLDRAKRAWSAFASEDLKEFVTGVNWGDHPEFIRFLVAVDKATGEGPVIEGSPPSGDKSAADVLFG